ncbi:hypothetical protein T484DRAFT_1776423 [Baffinella frigidus]|nr:hypothetical protein T484DRAFT_1776423 [Cryptophyta sp. CCMP2293]
MGSTEEVREVVATVVSTMDVSPAGASTSGKAATPVSLVPPRPLTATPGEYDGGFAFKVKRRTGPELKHEGDLALHAIVGEEVFVHGTGNAREVRKVGVVRRVGDQIRVESEGHLMGLNDFCASASNTKKRPRECVHVVSTGLSLAKTMEVLWSVQGDGVDGGGDEMDDPEAGPSGDAEGGSALKKQRVNGHAASDMGGAAGNDAGYSSDGERAELNASQELMDDAATFEGEDSVAAEFDQPKVNFTSVMALCNKESAREAQERIGREAETFKNCLEAVKQVMMDRDAAMVSQHGPPSADDSTAEPKTLAAIKATLEVGGYPHHMIFAADMRLTFRAALTVHDSPDDTENLERLGEVFEELYDAICLRARQREEAAVVKALPPGAKEAAQRELNAWAIIDSKGAFLAPWHAGEALSPGGVPPRPFSYPSEWIGPSRDGSARFGMDRPASDG